MALTKRTKRLIVAITGISLLAAGGGAAYAYWTLERLGHRVGDDRHQHELHGHDVRRDRRPAHARRPE